MAINLHRVHVEGLFNIFDLDVPIEDNTLILVGENGSGKSTLINLVYYALTAQWDRLMDFPFRSCTITIDHEEYRINKDSLQKYRQKDGIFSVFQRRMPKAQLESLLEKLAEHSQEYWNSARGFAELREISRTYSVRYLSFSALLELAQNNPLYSIDENTSDETKADIKALSEILHLDENEQVLFLPTYRRIEKELSDVIPDLNVEDTAYPHDKKRRSRRSASYIELVEFGMTDVASAFDSTLTKLDQSFRNELNILTGSYLHDILQGLYRNVDVSLLATDEVAETVDLMLSRIGEDILSKDDREKLKNLLIDIDSRQNLSVEQRISAHFLTSLIGIHKAQREREIPIRKFVELVNQYLSHKSLEFNPTAFELFVRRLDTEELSKVPLHGLSSGEKQIVSLFSHVFLSGYEDYFVVIDEPELSISVPWQKRFLQDLKDTGKCSGLIAVTHSPFVFDNSLAKYAHSISEFVR